MMSDDLAGLAIKHLLYPLWAVKNRSPRMTYWRRLEKSQYQSHEALRHGQLLLLQELLKRAYADCPHYRRKLDSAGVHPHDVRELEDVQAIPTLSKDEIQMYGPDMISRRVDRARLLRDQTGGSTGSPIQFFYDTDRLDSRVAATLRHNRWAGWDVGDRVAVLWGAPQDMTRGAPLMDRIREWIQDRRILLDASALDESSMRSFTLALRRFKPKILCAYANTLGLYARHLQDLGIDDIRPRSIVCSAEVLTPENRALIERTFACPVFDRYGCREFSVIASECDVHDGMHINAENLLVEVLVEGRPTSNGTGEIVITDLRNHAMPLIRYAIADLGRLHTQPCRCSRGLPLLTLSGGRSTDFLVATNGKRVSGVVMATYVATGIPGIRQIQFLQNTRATISVRLVKSPGWTPATLEQLQARARQYLGDDMRFEFDFCTGIPAERSGKYRFSICTIGPAP